MNQMHRSYDISQRRPALRPRHLRRVPIRWIDDFGWRPMSEIERVASAHYYRELGRHMGIRDIPETWQEFARLLDDYEREHFAFDAGGRARRGVDDGPARDLPAQRQAAGRARPPHRPSR